MPVWTEKDGTRLAKEGCSGVGVYISKSWQTALWFGRALLRVQLTGGTQNKMLYAVTGQTAAEIIVFRADASKENMALTSWKGSIVRKQDIFIAKNYLRKDEIDTQNRLVVIFLETAELRAKERMDTHC